MKLKYRTRIEVSLDGLVTGTIYQKDTDADDWIEQYPNRKTVWYYYIMGQTKEPELFNTLEELQWAIAQGEIKMVLSDEENAILVEQMKADGSYDCVE